MSHKTHIVPTHLRTPETLLTLAGFNLSIRQFLLLLLGGTMSYSLWLHLSALGFSLAGQVLRLILALLPTLLTAVLAFARLAGRTLDRWLLVALWYLRRPRRFVWHSIRYREAEAFEISDGQEGGTHEQN